MEKEIDCKRKNVIPLINPGTLEIKRFERKVLSPNKSAVPKRFTGRIKERIMKRYETKRIKIEKLLTLGYTTSGDP